MMAKAISSVLLSAGVPFSSEDGRRMKIKTGTSDAAEVVRVANGLASAGISFRVSFSQFNRETVVVSAFTRDETAHIKYYASNRTQAENVADDLSSVEIANIKDVGQMEFSF